MFKKIISSLIIVSIFLMDVARAMERAGVGGDEGGRRSPTIRFSDPHAREDPLGEGARPGEEGMAKESPDQSPSQRPDLR